MLVVGFIVLSIFVRGPHTTHEGGSDAINYTSFHAEMTVKYDPEMEGRPSHLQYFHLTFFRLVFEWVTLH